MKRVLLVALTPMLLVPALGSAAKTERPQESGASRQPATYVLPIVRRDALLNGLQMILLEQPGSGRVLVRVRVNSGAMFDLAGKGGLADLTAGMLLRGGGDLTATDVAGLVEQFELNVKVEARWDSTEISLSGPAASLDGIFELLSRLVITPAFDEKELESLKKQRVDELKSAGTRDSDVVFERAVDTVYRNHPFGKPLRGSVESISGITRRDLQFFHQRYYIANNSQLMAVGDTTADEVNQLARSKLGSWLKGEIIPATFRPPEAPNSRRVRLINRAETETAHAVLAQEAYSRRAPDYFAALLMTEVLRDLNSNLAVSTPGVSITTAAYPRFLPGPLAVTVECPVNQLGSMLEAIIANFNHMQSREPAIEALELARFRVIEEFARQMNSVDGAVESVLDIELYGLGRNYLLTFSERLNEVSPSDVRRASQTYLRPGLLTVAVAAPADRIDSALKKVGEVSAID